MKFIVTIVVCLLSTFCRAQKADLESWLKQNTLDLKYDSLLLEPLEYKKLAACLIDKKIVALGEPTHGSKEAQLLRLKIFRFLVQHKGFTTIALEAIDNSGAVNDFLLFGKGSSFDAVKSMGMWMLGTEETAQLVSWMREYNSSHTKKLRFYGTDLNYKFNVKLFKDSLSNVNGIQMDLLDSISLLNEKYLGKKVDPPKEPMEKLKLLVDGLHRNIVEHRSIIEKEVSKDYYNFLVYNIRTHNQAIELYILGKGAPSHYRDSCMAVNLGFISENFSDQGKVFYGSHNGHIQYGNHLGAKTTGSFLKQSFQNGFYNLGVEFGRYTFRSLIWVSKEKKYVMNINTIPGYKRNSLGDVLQNIQLESFYIDFGSSPKDRMYESLFSKFRPILYAGWLFTPGYENDFYVKNMFSSLYDGLIYYKNSSATTIIAKKNAN
jgi:erythromycin esterase